MAGFGADRRKLRLHQPGVEPGREWTGFEADPAEGPTADSTSWAFDAEGGGDDEGGAPGSAPPVVIPEPPRTPASRPGDLWILRDHRLLCGDSTNHDDVRRLMNGKRAVLFATDPP